MEKVIKLEFNGVTEEEQEELIDVDFQPGADPVEAPIIEEECVHIWQNSYVFGVERCRICKATRRRQK